MAKKSVTKELSNKNLTISEIFLKGWRMAELKDGKDPISGYLEGTKEHRMFMEGWNDYLNKLDDNYKSL